MLFCGSLVALALAFVSSVYAFSPGFPYGSQKVRGVNLGGWLVFLFENTGNNSIVDEWTFCESAPDAQNILKNHWETWIIEQDFAAISAAGLNHVRLPIGYWAWDSSHGEPYIQGQLPYLDRAVEWASEYGLKVIIDLHGAPGSQNGFDNSGHRVGFPAWHTEKDAVARTNAIIKSLASKFANNPSVVPIISPLNEPAGFYDEMMPTVKQYWLDSYGNVRFPFGTPQQSNTVVIIQDAFKGLDYWNDFMTGGEPTWSGVVMDIHIYQMFSNEEVARTDDEHISAACSRGNSLSSFHLWTIVGEWTTAPTDCAKYLNGRGRGARYDGSFDGSDLTGSCLHKSGSGDNFDDGYRTFLRKYWEAQTLTFEKGAGWVYWTWKAEQADDWSYEAGLQKGWLPWDLHNRTYPEICK